MLLFEACPPQDPWKECRRLVAPLGARRSARPLRVRLLTVATKQLVAKGAREEARALFAETLVCISQAAADLPSEGARERYLAKTSAKLQEIVVDAGGNIPLFIPAPTGSFKGVLGDQQAPKTLLPATLILSFLMVVGIVLASWAWGPSAPAPEQKPARGEMRDEEMNRIMNRIHARQLNEDVNALEALRDGNAEPATEYLESKIDGIVRSLERDQKTGQRSSELMSALARVRGYRHAHPRSKGQPSPATTAKKALDNSSP